MSYAHWHVGMKVVCIAQRPSDSPVDARYPVENHIYTLREIRDDKAWGGAGIVVLLNELDNRHFIGRFSELGGYHVEPGFSPKGFRPVQERRTDIGIFTAMLSGQKVDA